MIKFFRKIRQKLISDSNVGKYLMYAVGEIVLVMIGILLALQVNNWNELRKLKLKEKEILIEIKNDIEVTNLEIASDFAAHLEMLMSVQYFKERLAQNDPNKDSLTMDYRRLSHDLQIYPKSGGFETLKSQGFDIITNDSLRVSISNLYQLEYSRLTKFGRLNPESDIIKLLRPYTLRHFRTSKQDTRIRRIEENDGEITNNRLELKSISDLKNDDEFFVILEQTLGLRSYKRTLHRRALINGAEILELIEAELDPDSIKSKTTDHDISKILVGDWESEQVPGIIVTIFQEDDQLYCKTNVDSSLVKYLILSDTRFWSSNGFYNTINKSGDEYLINVSDTKWKKVKE